MKERGLVGEMPKRWRHPSAAPSDSVSAPNTLDRGFDVSAPKRVWASDIAYIHTWEGWLYLAVVIDLFSRGVVGWSMQSSMHTDIVLSAPRFVRRHREARRGDRSALSAASRLPALRESARRRPSLLREVARSVRRAA
jgi:putative transposase